jgi:hypothetical protein
MDLASESNRVTCFPSKDPRIIDPHRTGALHHPGVIASPTAVPQGEATQHQFK